MTSWYSGAGRFLPRGLLRAVVGRLTRASVRWGSLRHTTPVSRVFGFDRGSPIDRYYIELFLAAHSADVLGRVLEVGDATYTRRFGGSAVTRADVLHAVAGNPEATIVGDLATGQGVPRHVFDCMILTQVLNFLLDVPAAIATAHQALKPGGVLLATVGGISQISRYDMDRWGDYWRFTDLSARKLFEREFGEGNVEVTTYGNVLAAVAFLEGVSREEMRQAELDHHDPDYQVTIAIRAVRQ